MKVAIIGAGLSGLSCAYALQKKGILAEVFEKTTIVGENLELPVILLKMLDSPMRDPLKYIKKNLDITLNPNYDINEINIVTQNKTTIIPNHVGWIFRRGSFKGCMNEQIRKLVVAPIILETPINFKDIKNKYDHVVIASGSLSEADEMRILNLTFNAFTRIATVEGNFRTDSVTMWINTEYSKNSYAYLVPDTDTLAKLVLIVNDIKHYELDTYWEKFLTIENIQYKIIKTLDISHKVGRCSSVQIGNLYFAGFAGGFIDDFIGIGSPYAIISGGLAAQAIIEGKNYTELMKRFTKDIKKKHTFREAMNLSANPQFDAINNLADNDTLKFLTYKNPLFRLTQIRPLVKTYNAFKKKENHPPRNHNLGKSS